MRMVKALRATYIEGHLRKPGEVFAYQAEGELPDLLVEVSADARPSDRDAHGRALGGGRTMHSGGREKLAG